MIALKMKMKMPRTCADCRFAQAQGQIWFWCSAEFQLERIENANRRPDWCPLIEVAAVAPVLPEMTVAKKFS